ncbi:MAG: hypothetical protein ABSB76_33290 [Streptosporangiaceae bacterium]
MGLEEAASVIRTYQVQFVPEHLTSALYLDKPVEVDSYLDVMEQLCLQAEGAVSTYKVISNVLADI